MNKKKKLVEQIFTFKVINCIHKAKELRFLKDELKFVLILLNSINQNFHFNFKNYFYILLQWIFPVSKMNILIYVKWKFLFISLSFSYNNLFLLLYHSVSSRNFFLKVTQTNFLTITKPHYKRSLVNWWYFSNYSEATLEWRGNYMIL